MNQKLNSIPFLIILFLCSCNNKNQLEIRETNFAEQIEQRQNLIFTFNSDVVPDSLTDHWDSLSYFHFTPAVKGLFKWQSAHELLFSPTAEFKAATTYKAVLNDVAFKHATKKQIGGATSYSFHTPWLSLASTESSWALSSISLDKLSLRTRLTFNYPVDPNDLQQHVTLQLNNHAITYRVLTTQTASEIEIKLDGIAHDETANTQLTVNVSKGMGCVNCGTALNEPLTVTSTISSPAKLEITAVETSLANNEGVIHVSCNQPVVADQLNNLVKMEPKVKSTIEQSETGFDIRGPFSEGVSYDLHVLKTLKGLIGGEMENDYHGIASFAKQQPAIAFTNSKGFYLSSKGSMKIGIQITQIPKVRVSVFKIYENNILSFMKHNRYSDYWEEGDGDAGSSAHGWDYSDYDLNEYGNEVMNQIYETRNLPKLNGVSLLSLDFEDRITFKGVYLVTVRSSEDQWMKATRMVAVSDIGLIAHCGDDEVTVFANSIKNATPINDVKVSVMSSSNQVLFTGTTNGDGMVKFTGLHQRYPDFRTGMITASSSPLGDRGVDNNFLLMSDTRVEQSRFETGGLRENLSGYMAFIYGEREIYRPGETMYFNTVVRNNDWEALKEVPVKIKVLLPNGRELISMRKTLNKQGACETSVVIPAAAVTGTYVMEVYSGNDVLLGNKNTSVEEFIPDRINVTLQLDKEKYKLSDTIHTHATAVNLFGPPAANRNYEVNLNLNRKNFTAKGFEEYNFNINGADKVQLPSILRQGKTNAEGKLNEQFILDNAYNNIGMLSAKAFVTVFDETGRPVNRVQQFDVQTQQTFFGVRVSEYYGSVHQPIQIGFIATNADGHAQNASAQVQLIKINYHDLMQKSGDQYHFVSQKEEHILKEQTIQTSASGATLPFTPNESGEYVVRVFTPNSDKYVESTFYAYGWGYTQNGAFAINNEGKVDITLDKTNYVPGDKARLLFKTPFNGKLLVTVERNKVYEYFYLNTDKKTAQLTLPVEEEYLPNVYITATLFKPLDDGSMPLTVAHGTVPLSVEKTSNHLPVTITVAEKSRSKTKQTIRIKTIPKSDVEITVAVVDEGIMQLKNSKTPDPYNYFYQKRALQTELYDVYPYLFPDLKLKRSSTGGDGYDLQKRVNPFSNKRINPVAFWSGILHTNSSGEATCSVDIPQFSGDLRVMAVAYRDKSFGNAEKHIKVADPVVLSSALPRFLSPGDTVLMPVTLINTTSQVINGALSIAATSVKVINDREQKITLKPNAESQYVFKLLSPPEVGQANITSTVKAGGEVFTEKTDIVVRPPASLQKKTGSGIIIGGKSSEFDLQTAFIPSSTSGKLILSRSPLVQFSDQLSYLLDYPHGCVEQTTSIAFPQLYYADLIKSISNKPGGVINISNNIQAAIAKLQGMQMYNGALSYWEGGNEECWWGTVYAAHFLTEAYKAGYNINNTVLDKIFTYLEQKVKEKKTETLYYYDANNKEQTKVIPSKDIFYSLYILALNGHADVSTMNYYKARFNEMAIDSRYLLACTYLATGDRNSYTNLLPHAFEGEFAKNAFGGNYYSYTRDVSISLNTLLTVDADNPQIPVMVKQLSQQLAKQKYLNTQERAFAFLALGKFMNKNSNNNVTASINVEGGMNFDFKGSDLILKHDVVNHKINIQTNGHGTLYYSYEVEGLTKDGFYKQEDSFLKVRKTFLNRFGQTVSGTTYNQNDLIVVKITLENTVGNDVDNVVITDMLPAGFEIENPRVGAVPELNWIKDNITPDYIDMRDDRINLYTKISRQPKNFYYLVRAVSTGNYVMGPVSADAMYNGEYHSYNGAGRIKIK